jgi:hypothetical protein
LFSHPRLKKVGASLGPAFTHFIRPCVFTRRPAREDGQTGNGAALQLEWVYGGGTMLGSFINRASVFLDKSMYGNAIMNSMSIYVLF